MFETKVKSKFKVGQKVLFSEADGNFYKDEISHINFDFYKSKGKMKCRILYSIVGLPKDYFVEENFLAIKE